MFFPAGLLPNTEETAPNTTKANIHREHKYAVTLTITPLVGPGAVSKWIIV